MSNELSPALPKKRKGRPNGAKNKKKENTGSLSLFDNATTNSLAIAVGTDLNNVITSSVPKFPIWGLPKLLRTFCEEGADVYGVPIDFLAMPIIVATGAAIGKKAVWKDKFQNYPLLWTMIVANSGVGKSQPLGDVIDPINKINNTLYQEYQQQLKKWRADSKSAKKEGAEEPDKPLLKKTIVVDTTPEALCAELGKNSNGLILYRDELSGWFDDMGRYNKSGEVANYISIYDFKTFSVDRKGDEPMLIEDPFLSIIGTIQPNILRSKLIKKGFVDSGFAPRFCFVYPDNVPRSKYSDKSMPEELKKEYYEYIQTLHNSPILNVEASREVKDLYINFFNANVDRANETDDDHLKSLYSKMDIILCRIALSVCVAKYTTGEIEKLVIDDSTMQYSIEVCDYLIATGKKVLGDLFPNQNTILLPQAELIRQLHKHKPDMNQSKFGESIGVSQQYVGKVINK